MLAIDIEDKDLLFDLVKKELRELGIKHRKEKKGKTTQLKNSRKNIFRTPLHSLELTDVILSSGGVVQIPLFVSVACQRILEEVYTEGLFRKAGSALRQKAIRADLEAGLQLGSSHHVIDVANILKLFFRELPDPLVASNVQEIFLRSLLCGENKIEAILMCCLLLPPLTGNTLAFFMQFLNNIAMHSAENRMTVQNLAIIFTPGIMPLDDITGVRFNNHVKVLETLIANAKKIGVIPSRIMVKLQAEDVVSIHSQTEKKRKKRRSGSLTRVFNGIRKFVGGIGSSENLDDDVSSIPSAETVPITPCLSKSAKKRKMAESASGFTSKKKKELMSLFPQNGGLLPNTPICVKETKKSRLSLGGRKNLKPTEAKATSTVNSNSMERRWSVVGSSWSRKKHNAKDIPLLLPNRPLSPVISMPCIPVIQLESDSEKEKSLDGSFVRISKSEYEAIKERVSAIETRISQEFGTVRRTCLFSPSISDADDSAHLSGPEKVLDKFERTVEETESICSPGTEQLAKRLSRELKIRRSAEHQIFRSPSARKIGTIRRRSRENVKLSRNKTWHISASKKEHISAKNYITEATFYPKANLKRGQPNTIQSGLSHPQLQPVSNDEQMLLQINSVNHGTELSENWISGERFFKETKYENSVDATNAIVTPKRLSRKNSEALTTPLGFAQITPMIQEHHKTPMLPPSSALRRATKTPLSTAQRNIAVNSKKKGATLEIQNGRASLARIRSQNAGMVLAKAKLFDDLNADNGEVAILTNFEIKRKSINDHKSIHVPKIIYRSERSSQKSEVLKPRPETTLSKSPGHIQKRHKPLKAIKIEKAENVYANIENISQNPVIKQLKSKKNYESPRSKHLRNKMGASIGRESIRSPGRAIRLTANKSAGVVSQQMHIKRNWEHDKYVF